MKTETLQKRLDSRYNGSKTVMYLLSAKRKLINITKINI
jgi:hypothetical protein